MPAQCSAGYARVWRATDGQPFMADPIRLSSIPKLRKSCLRSLRMENIHHFFPKPRGFSLADDWPAAGGKALTAVELLGKGARAMKQDRDFRVMRESLRFGITGVIWESSQALLSLEMSPGAWERLLRPCEECRESGNGACSLNAF